MQAFEDLKQDIQNLIDTASDTIQSLVDEAVRRSQSQSGGVSGGAGVVGSTPSDTSGSEFTSQVEELRVKIRAAIENLKHQAKTALENPALSGGGNTGGQIGSGGAGGVSTGDAPASDPSVSPQPGPGLNEASTDSNNVDDQMPAGGSAQPPNTTPVPPAPEFGGSGSTIGPDSFKSGA